jgi:hypothetical protein
MAQSCTFLEAEGVLRGIIASVTQAVKPAGGGDQPGARRPDALHEDRRSETILFR